MITAWTRDLPKKIRFAGSVFRKRLIHVNLQILYDCNFRCRICDFWKSEQGQGMLSAADAETISARLNALGPQIISIGGGEPTLHPELVQIVHALSRHHFPVMISNGSRITPELARTLFDAGMVEISVSLDYADPKKHDEQRGVSGAYEKAVRALEILQENRTHPEQRVNLIAVVMDDNLSEMQPLLNLSKKLGITFLVTLYSHSRGNKPQQTIPADVSQQLLTLKKKHPHFVSLRGYVERFSEALVNGGIGPCSAGRNLWNIDAEGNVTFCIDHLENPIGNLLTDKAENIWAASLKRYSENRCRDCWTSCRGSIEALLYGKRPLLNLWDYFQMTRPIRLRGRF